MPRISFKNKVRILIVDDDPECCSSLSLFLNTRGYQTKTAENGKLGWELAQSWKPDIALIDIVMPGINGLELTRRIKSSPELSNTQVIIVSVKHTPEEIRQGFEAGATDYVSKPFVNAELISRTESVIRHKELEAERERLAQQKSVQQSLQKINSKLAPMLKNLTGYLGILKNIWRCEHANHQQWVLSLYEESIRLQFILRELQKIDRVRILEEAKPD